MIYKIIIEPTKGATINSICEAAVAISEDYDCHVEFTFNDKKIIQPAPLTKNQKAQKLLESWEATEINLEENQ